MNAPFLRAPRESVIERSTLDVERSTLNVELPTSNDRIDRSYIPRPPLFLLAIILCILGSCTQLAKTPTADTTDPNLWLEDITSEKSLAWVHQQNDRSIHQLTTTPEFEPIRKRLLSILDSKERIPYVEKHGEFFYNFWRDDTHTRGLWRRTTLAQYKTPNPKWETVLDLDQLATADKENWVWESVDVLKPDEDRALITLSRGGADAAVVREFDLKTKQFVIDGFALPEAKSDVAWRDRNTLYVGTNFGPDSLTKSGYPRIIKEWQRGTPLAQAATVFEGKPDDVQVSSYVAHTQGHIYEFIDRGLTFFSDEIYLRRGPRLIYIDKPADAQLQTFGEFMLLQLRSDWAIAGHTYTSGSLIAENFEDYLKGKRDFVQIFKPSPHVSLASINATTNYLILTELDNVRSRPYVVGLSEGGATLTPINVPPFATTDIIEIEPEDTRPMIVDGYFLSVQDFLTPTTLYLDNAQFPHREKLKSLPAFFDTTGLQIQQQEAISKDGTRIPYFIVGRADLPHNGKNPTLLSAYGGFEVSMQPYYDATAGSAWLNRGGTYVLANIRGGGEFGPQWHEAARKQNRQRAYDDFIAVAEDLIARKITSPKHLGIQGASNGGLLMGVMLTERPDLFGAVACGSPLLDMRRYHKLLAGASWLDEYGNPDDPADWAYLSKFSPYQNLRPGIHYPPVLFTTSTRDDRVHPGHARKMAARMESLGAPVLYYENTEGGHAAADTHAQSAFMDALQYTFLLQHLR
jgi:prolyl oligopeptidase